MTREYDELFTIQMLFIADPVLEMNIYDYFEASPSLCQVWILVSSSARKIITKISVFSDSVFSWSQNRIMSQVGMVWVLP